MASSSNDERLTEELACRVMGWKLAPNRFLKPGRSWIPRWRFRPLVQLTDAFQLLDRSAHRYTLVRDGRTFTAEIQTKFGPGIAVGKLQARTISLAIARGLGLEVER